MLKFDTRPTDLAETLASIPRETIAMVGEAPLTIPTEVPPSVALGYARTRLNRGEELALTWALELMLGSDGFSLMMSSDIDSAGLDTIMDIVVSRIRGATTGTADAAPKASSSSAPTRRTRAASPARSRAAKK